MRVLLVDGFAEPSELTDAARSTLTSRHHEITDLRLVAEGFDRFMSADERRAYHEVDNLVTEETRRSADLVRSHDALLVVSPLVQGSVSPHVKGWFERVFIPEVSFTFTNSGRITAALTNIRRVGMIVDCATDEREPHRRQGSTRSVLRGVRLNAARTCRTTYLPIRPGDDAPARIERSLRRW